MAILCLNFWKTSIPFSIEAASVYICTQQRKRGFFSLHLCQHLLLLILLMTTILTGVRWNSLWFWFAFPWWLMMLSIFSCACWPSACLLWKKMSVQFLCPFFKLDCLGVLPLSYTSSLFWIWTPLDLIFFILKWVITMPHLLVRIKLRRKL